MSVDISIVYGVLMAGCGLVASIWGVVKIIKEIKKPSTDLAKKVAAHEQRLSDGTERFELGEARMQRMEDNNKMIMRCFLALLNHEITGNDISSLKRIREELTDYLTQI